MKTYFLMAGLLGLAAACGSSSGTSDAPALATSPTTENADPRVAQIRDLHQQLLSIQKPLEATEKNPIMAGSEGVPRRHQEFLDMVAASQGIIGTIDQLDPGKRQEPAQLELVGESLRREQAMVTRAKGLVALNQDWIDYVQKSNKQKKSL